MKCHFEVNCSLIEMKKKDRSLHQPNTGVQLTLLILLLGHHSHGHGGLGAWLCSPQWQPADLQRAEIALQSVFGGGVPLLHVLLPFCWSHPVVHLKAHQFRLTCRTAANNQKGRYGEMYCCTNRVQASGKKFHSNEICLPAAYGKSIFMIPSILCISVLPVQAADWQQAALINKDGRRFYISGGANRWSFFSSICSTCLNMYKRKKSLLIFVSQKGHIIITLYL